MLEDHQDHLLPNWSPSSVKTCFNRSKVKLIPVIQATGRSEFEDGLGSGDFVPGYSYHMSDRALCCLTIQCRPNSKANGLAMLMHLYPLYEHRSKAALGWSVLGIGDPLLTARLTAVLYHIMRN
jgi:hypothetical protein